MKQLRGTYLKVLIAICGIVAAALGMLTNVSGLFFTPIAAELGVGRGSVSMTLTISNLIFAVGGIFAVRFIRIFHFKRILILGAAIFAGSTALMAACSSLIPLYILNAVRGFAAGVVGNVTVTMMITNWFHSNTGLITSIAMGFSGVAGAVITPVLSAVIERFGWRQAYIVDAVIIALLYLPAILMKISFRPDDMSMEPMGELSEVKTVAPPQENPSLDRVLLLLAFAYAILVAFISSFPPHMPSVATSFGFSAAVGSGMLSACLVANTLGKIAFGVLADKLGTRLAIFLYCIIFGAAAILLLTIHVVGLMVPFAVMFGVVYTLPTVALVLIVRDAFGGALYASVYPKISMAMTIVNAFGTTIIGYIYDGTGSYTIPLILCAAIAGLSIVVTLLVYQRKAHA